MAAPDTNSPQTASDRNLVVVSGYYGFGNLGDEAILEEIVNELKRAVSPENIVVLSQNPAVTERAFGVKAQDRWQMAPMIALFRRTRLFISGGGGLFQDTTSVKSVIYYFMLIYMAKLLGARAIVYAQGLGPLKSALGKVLTRCALSFADGVTVRDAASLELLRSWKIQAELTADPVWCLAQTGKSDLPQVIQIQLDKPAQEFLVGLSLRESGNLTEWHLKDLAYALNRHLPSNMRLLLLPLQREQDEPVLMAFQRLWQAAGRSAEMLELSKPILPSQWLSIMEKLDLVVAMRLHALIFAAKTGTAAVGIAYDPKVTHLMSNLGMPILNLPNQDTPDGRKKEWSQTLESALEHIQELSERSRSQAEAQKNLACQNFNLIARILNMQSDLSQ